MRMYQRKTKKVTRRVTGNGKRVKVRRKRR